MLHRTASHPTSKHHKALFPHLIEFHRHTLCNSPEENWSLAHLELHNEEILFCLPYSGIQALVRGHVCHVVLYWYLGNKKAGAGPLGCAVLCKQKSSKRQKPPARWCNEPCHLTYYRQHKIVAHCKTTTQCYLTYSPKAEHRHPSFSISIVFPVQGYEWDRVYVDK